MGFSRLPAEETVEQLQELLRLLDRLPGKVLDDYYAGIAAFLDGTFLPDAQEAWKQTSRREQIAHYIEWLYWR